MVLAACCEHLLSNNADLNCNTSSTTNVINCVFPSLPLDWSIGVGSEGGTGAMALLLFEVGAGMNNVQWVATP